MKKVVNKTSGFFLPFLVKALHFFLFLPQQHMNLREKSIQSEKTILLKKCKWESGNNLYSFFFVTKCIGLFTVTSSNGFFFYISSICVYCEAHLVAGLKLVEYGHEWKDVPFTFLRSVRHSSLLTLFFSLFKSYKLHYLCAVIISFPALC